MPVRTSRGQKQRHRRRRSREEEPAAVVGHSRSGAPAPERRDRDAAQDEAVYNCQCGMVFSAPVCTSVGCPHCGTNQAW